MALKLHVISHSSTGAVLAMCTRGEGDTAANVASVLVGDGLPLVVPVAAAFPLTVGTIDESELVVDALTTDPASPNAVAIIASPLSYNVTRDLLGNFRSIQEVDPPAVTLNVATGLNFVIPQVLPSTSPTSVWIWMKVVDSEGKVVASADKVLTTTINNQSFSVPMPLTLTASYAVVLLVQSFAAVFQKITAAA